MITVDFRGQYGEFCYQTFQSVGADLCSQEEIMIQPGKVAKIPTGVYISQVLKMNGYVPELQVRPRSGLSLKGIWCSFGTIDPDYPGEIAAILLNTTDTPYLVCQGERVAQLVPSFTKHLEGVLVKNQKREGGFGSTGK